MNGMGPRKKKGKGKKKAAGRRASAGGLLGRLFGGDDKKGQKKGQAAGRAGEAKRGERSRNASPRRLTPLERSIQEIKHMSTVGKSDPERLAMMLSRMLEQERQKQAQAQAEFEKMVWDIVHKDEAGDAEAEDEESSPR